MVRRRDAATAIVTSAALVIFAIGFSRLYLGVLYFSDIVGIYASGAVWLAACITGIELARRQSRFTLTNVGLQSSASAGPAIAEG